MGPGRLELPTSRLSGVRSNQLSYGPNRADAPRWERKAKKEVGSAWAAPMSFTTRETEAPREVLVIPRKEVIQPQVLLRLPCYDLVPVTGLTVGASSPCGLGQRLRALPASVA